MICGNCSKNRVVILHQSNRPVRVCDDCFLTSYNHLNSKIKKLSTNSVPNQNLYTTQPSQSKEELIDEKAAKQIETQIESDDDKNERVEEWVNLSSKTQLDDLVVETKTDDNLELINETIDKIELDEPVSEPKSSDEKECFVKNSDDQLDECKNESFHNNQTSDSEDEHNELSSSIEDILDEGHGEVGSFYINFVQDHFRYIINIIIFISLSL